MSSSSNRVFARLGRWLACKLAANWVVPQTAAETAPAATIIANGVRVTTALPAPDVPRRMEISISAPAVAAAAAPASSHPSADFHLAARLQAVAKHNCPSSRASRRAQSVAVAGRAVRLNKAAKTKISKDTRLPTSFATRQLTMKPRNTAEVIQLNVVSSPPLRDTAQAA